MMKRLMAILFACVLLVGAFPLVAEAAGNTVNGSVYRVYGLNRYETSTLIADKLLEDTQANQYGSVIIASGANFPDALAGSYLAAVTGAPIILTSKNRSIDMAWFKTNVAADANVYILGGDAVVSKNAETQLSAYKVERLAGGTRYETNLIILKKAIELGGSTQDILVCTGNNFADSLSASATGKAILLVGNALKEEQKAFLRSATCENIYILGGTAAVSAKIENELASFGSTARISGSNRYETSTKIAEAFFPNANSAVIAYAKNFPDGLCGGPLAINMEAPLILTASGNEAMAANYAKQAGINSGIVLGGSGLISDHAAKNIFGTSEIITYEKQLSASCKHTYSDASCTSPKTCKLCGATEGNAIGHKWMDATCTAPKTCNICGTTEGSASGHNWKDATCTAPKTCETCGATEGLTSDHSWKDATCTDPVTCEICGATEGSASGHSWQNATCTVPKTCSDCGATEGTAAGHNYNETVTAPTCTLQGYTTYTCACGDTYTADYTDASHNYEKYKCVNCGEVDKVHAYEYLIEWVKSNGIADGTYVSFDYYLDSDEYSRYSLLYNATDNYLSVTNGYYVDEFYCYISINLDTYFYGYAFGDLRTFGYIEPADFTSNSPITYKEYVGPSELMWDMLETTRLSINDLLSWLDWCLDTYDVGITIKDLGFESYLPVQ